ncbi:hypothetical protein VTN00DRAFT_2308 [Thermoascus crustaceus]|uniref:uncharacterized protein n=1 Tax=Thermoascus crustaceus TaxID=5088 RepID=UPI0037434B0C
MPQLRKWIRSRLRRDRGIKIDKLPVLFQERPPRLSAPLYSFTSDSLDLSIPDPSAAIAASTFFTKLPLELRHQIYVCAFGGRTVHMDLRSLARTWWARGPTTTGA